jgi:hypothetical protein
MSDATEHTSHEDSDETMGPMLFIALVAMGAFMAVGAGEAHSMHDHSHDHSGHDESSHDHAASHDHAGHSHSAHAHGDSHDRDHEQAPDLSADDLAAEAAAQTLRELEAAGEINSLKDLGEEEEKVEVIEVTPPAVQPKPALAPQVQAVPKEQGTPAAPAVPAPTAAPAPTPPVAPAPAAPVE